MPLKLSWLAASVKCVFSDAIRKTGNCSEALLYWPSKYSKA